MQNPFHQRRWRAACRIAAVLALQQPSGVSLVLPQPGWQTLQMLQRQQVQALERGWQAAAAAIQDRWQQQFRWWLTALELRGQDVMTSRASRPVSVATITAELAALEDEFPAVELDLQTSTVAVTTADITLDDVPLGPFQLVWNWSRSGRSGELRVVAQAPCRPAGRSDVTHPHVLDEALCVGEAREPLARALQSGRLGDYFLILRQVLETYNARSAYVALSDWHGGRCAACDDHCETDDLSACQHCGDALCADCGHPCATCGHAHCDHCLQACPDCDDRFCDHCWPGQSRRRGETCPACRDLELAEEEPDENGDDDEKLPIPPESAIHADCLGEAAVLAGPG